LPDHWPTSMQELWTETSKRVEGEICDEGNLKLIKTR
jgi:hypothetical protein